MLGLFLTYNIFRSKANYIGLLWVIIAYLLINGDIFIIRVPFSIPILKWLIYSLLFIELIQMKKFKRNWKIFPFKKIITVLIIGSLLISFLDPRLSIFQKCYFPFEEITITYMVLFLGYITINSTKDLERLKKPMYYAIIIITLYGIFNFISGTNPYYRFVLDNFYEGGDVVLKSKLRAFDTTLDRFRGTSTFNLSFDYGYASSLIAIYFLYALDDFRTSIAFIGIIAGLIGAVICNSRTVFFAVIVAIGIYVFFATLNLAKIAKITFLIILIGIFSFSTIPVLQKSIDNTLDIFISGGDNVAGSSLMMRQIQLLGAVNYFLQSPIRGNGFKYIDNELGWGDRDNVAKSKMRGFESIIYQFMIEQGLIGLVTKLIFLILLITYFLKKRKYSRNKNIAALGLAMTILFIIFTIGTGPLRAWPLTMLFLGAIIKTIQLNEISNHNS